MHLSAFCVLFTSTLSAVVFPCFSGIAHADARVPVSALNEPFGASAALFGGGTAIVGDLSATDANPAGLALSKEIAITGEAKWAKANVLAVEAGVTDSLMAEIAAGLKARTATEASGAKDRRFSLGLAERLGESAFVVGLAGDYIQVERSDAERASGGKRFRETPRLRGGVIYNISETVLVGARTDGWLDRYDTTTSHALGAAFGFAGHFVANLDLVFANTKPDRALFGLTLLAKDYLDLRVSSGYGIESKRNGGAAGVTLKSQQFRLYYTFTKPVFSQKPFFHQVGAGIVVAM
ncbi:MAG: hypothetical protein IOD12_14565 [Silvanigrellales bacterium]|nr:hypothetical protein [Silvanigrellales bacterium]